MPVTAPRFGAAAVIRLLLITTALLGTLLAGAAPASAHAALTGSDPKDGAVVATAPKHITLTFSEKIALGNDSIRVLEPSGKRSDTGEVRDMSSGSIVQYGVPLHPGLPDGTYTVAWQAVSADSHPISGAFTFSIGAPSKTTVALPEETAGGGLVGALYGIARYTSYAGFILLVGGGAFVLACWQRGAGERPLQRLVVQGWITLTASTLAMLLLRAPYTGSGKLADAFDLSGLKAVLETKTGASLVSRLLLLGAAALFVAVLFGAYAKRDTPLNEEEVKEKKDLTFGLALGGGVMAAGIAATWALSEHASTGLQPAVAMPVDVLHLLAVATWLGGLAALLVALYRVPAIESGAVRNFSRVAFASVAVLAATGTYQSWRQVGSWPALTGTAYGQLLLVKIALVALLVGIAWISRRWTGRLAEKPVTEAAEAAAADEETAEEPEPVTVPDDPARAAQLARQKAAVTTARVKRVRDADPGRLGLRRSVLAEAAVAVVLLAVTTALTSTEPGRTEEKEAGKSETSTAAPTGPVDVRIPFDTGGEDGKGTARIELDPGRSGGNALHVWLERPNGRAMDAPEVKVAFTHNAKEIGPLPAAPDRISTGHWSANGVQIPLPGTWEIEVTVRTSDIDQVTVKKNVKIG
ncbi:copper resistance protein CopC/CopD [Streptomyces sp. ISL-96]|uniref:copper resistance CopC/CopD family protein n=1 Tax=Streptomyces sp. ISL-96 TaxID=2819191 RepID=UPI001BEADCA0|nr:copper resistance protein CopC [Streptomyces sp. ISL-96]MBT2490466.1 copper resistance protein CopC/CopD [Streptomyces sp. ISL-96]